MHAGINGVYRKCIHIKRRQLKQCVATNPAKCIHKNKKRQNDVYKNKHLKAIKIEKRITCRCIQKTKTRSDARHG